MSGNKLVRRGIGVLLMVDGLMAGLWFTGLLGTLGVRLPASVALIVVRLLAGMVSVVAGWLITQHRPPGVALAVGAAWLTTGVLMLGTWTSWLPSNLAPTLRWPMVGIYAAAAGLISVWARRKMRDDGAQT
jgi:hypothetical protein